MAPDNSVTLTGEPPLDAVLVAFSAMPEIGELYDPRKALGKCGRYTDRFVHYLRTLKCDDPIAYAWLKRCTSLHAYVDDLGYHDRTMGEYQWHTVVDITTKLARYMIDWTATQYGYGYLPLVQRMNDGQWERLNR